MLCVTTAHLNGVLIVCPCLFPCVPPTQLSVVDLVAGSTAEEEGLTVEEEDLTAVEEDSTAVGLAVAPAQAEEEEEEDLALASAEVASTT